MKNILVLPGDGIGKEVTHEAVRVLENRLLSAKTEYKINYALIGGHAIDEKGSPLPDETLEIAKKVDAILLGAIGGPKWENLDYSIRPERGLLKIRKELDLFANIRPALVFDELIDASTLKAEIIRGLDITIVRELTSGIYFGQPRGTQTLEDGTKRGINTEVYTTMEIERIAHVAFNLAMQRNKKVCSVDKANVLESSELWREVVIRISKEYPEVSLSHMYVDNAAMQLIRNPKQFDVILTSNLFGDILSDEASMLTGSLGMLPSSSMGKKGNVVLYEPIHGSAPDIAGKGIANPLATILSVCMMLEDSFGMKQQANEIRTAIKNTLADGYRTKDIATSGKNEQIVSTSEMGDAVLAHLSKI